MVTKIHKDIIKVVAPQLGGTHCAPGVTMTGITAEHEQSTVCIAFTLTTKFVGTIMLLLLHRPVDVCQSSLIAAYYVRRDYAIK